MALIVAKFGGSSLCDAARFQNVAQILRASPERRYVVASAPGKRFAGDDKVTDLLYRCHALARDGRDYSRELKAVKSRFEEIGQVLGLKTPVGELLEEDAKLFPSQREDFAASRGEALCSRLLAEYMGWEWIDAAQTICFDKWGRLDADQTDRKLSSALEKTEYAVIPGFYGSMPDGSVKTFSRGGSDVTGAIVARAARAQLYENWTDVPGVLAADPRIVQNPQRIVSLTYRELRAMSCMGATVLHEDAVLPVRSAGMPVNVRSTLEAENPGTRIQPYFTGEPGIRGVTGLKGFFALSMEMTPGREEADALQKALSVCREENQTVERVLCGVDTICLVVKQDSEEKRALLCAKLMEKTGAGRMNTWGPLALVAAVGQAVEKSPGEAARFAAALEQASIPAYFLDQCPGSLSVVAGVQEADCEGAVRALYQAMIEK